MFVKKLINGTETVKKIYDEDFSVYYADGWRKTDKTVETEKPVKKSKFYGSFDKESSEE